MTTQQAIQNGLNIFELQDTISVSQQVLTNRNINEVMLKLGFNTEQEAIDYMTDICDEHNCSLNEWLQLGTF